MLCYQMVGVADEILAICRRGSIRQAAWNGQRR